MVGITRRAHTGRGSGVAEVTDEDAGDDGDGAPETARGMGTVAW
ncbi:hypothetical protein [Streptomyces sp. NPDC126499]